VNVASLGRAPDFVEALEAWRVWRVVDRDSELSLGSVIYATIWPAGDPLIAECLRNASFAGSVRHTPPHDAPDTNCGCGIYGAGLDEVGHYLSEPLTYEGVARVLGRVALWGSVVECERGFRASHAYPVALYVPSDASREPRSGAEDIARRLGRYGVPVEVLPTPSRDAPALLRAPRRPERP
jgi:hypothetical protein